MALLNMSLVRNVFIFSCLLVVLSPYKFCLADFVVEQGNLKITNPPEIRTTVKVSLANFGMPLYGAQLRGVLQYAGDGVLGCKSELDPTGFPESFELHKQPGYATVLVISRGECKFVEKAWNALQLGAAAILVADNVDENLLTMDIDQDSPYLNNITIPVAMLSKEDAAPIIEAAKTKSVIGVMDWTDALPNPDERVEWEIWTNSNNGCGRFCSRTNNFVEKLAPYAKQLQSQGSLQFTPYYVTWMCLPEYADTPECITQCISHGKYCAPDPEDSFEEGYDGSDVVMENLRQICVFDVANKTGNPNLWWDYVTTFHRKCKMQTVNFNVECSEQVQQAIGINVAEVQKCAQVKGDDEHPLLQKQIDAQVGEGDRSDVELLPSLIINNHQYRGKLEVRPVLKALCAGFQESTEPAVCLADDISENECVVGGVGYLECKASQLGKTKCQDTFRGWECVCPEGTFGYTNGDGESACADVNECKGHAMDLDTCNCDRCVCTNTEPGFHCDRKPEVCTESQHQTCWHEELNTSPSKKDPKMTHFSACKDNISALKEEGVHGVTLSPAYTCSCPDGFTGDGEMGGDGCTDVDECESTCNGEHMKCHNVPGTFHCTCSHGGMLSDDKAMCIYPNGYPKDSGAGAVTITIIIVVVLAIVGLGGYALYRYRLRSYMDSEIRAIMAQYMPLDKDGATASTEAPDTENAL
mmetsp:Transcript_36321/g.43917  ORF Transcript_36321/g.43917 Transcript_36321/m.43917 type:complete len:698 (+) Transcript_36321:228-2321(+)|eukprot:CAMPEP_0197847182 /NCGR_PEP_ID=MMETSP1438-20131217/5409_1 /TAXON_ID=1461541 /ORGANISM="Pterosperma sp., Strain CCMP1384" /LENGTH=697 /DNA_ID=CAMNT_0043459031 /DNA_START=228 /DNA_END=2321 /DNA_ORIENTATION=-